MHDYGPLPSAGVMCSAAFSAALNAGLPVMFIGNSLF